MLFWKQNRQPKSSLTSSTGVGSPKELLEGLHERDHLFWPVPSDMADVQCSERKKKICEEAELMSEKIQDRIRKVSCKDELIELSSPIAAIRSGIEKLVRALCTWHYRDLEGGYVWLLEELSWKSDARRKGEAARCCRYQTIIEIYCTDFIR